MTKTKTICISGGFDPVHIGHLRMMQAASKYGDVIAIVNSDAPAIINQLIDLLHKSKK